MEHSYYVSGGPGLVCFSVVETGQGIDYFQVNKGKLNIFRRIRSSISYRLYNLKNLNKPTSSGPAWCENRFLRVVSHPSINRLNRLWKCVLSTDKQSAGCNPRLSWLHCEHNHRILSHPWNGGASQHWAQFEQYLYLVLRHPSLYFPMLPSFKCFFFRVAMSAVLVHTMMSSAKTDLLPGSDLSVTKSGSNGND